MPTPRAGTNVFGSAMKKNPNERPRITTRVLTLMIYKILEHNCSYPDMAVQDAIDWMASQIYSDRGRLLEWLKQELDHPTAPGRGGTVISALMESWTNDRLLKRATGRTRHEWLSL